MRLFSSGVLVVVAACGGRQPTIPFDPDAGTSAPVDAGQRWAAVEAAFLERVTARDGGAAIGLVVLAADGGTLFERYVGSINGASRIPVASASKLVSTMVLFDVIRRGALTLESTTGQVLGWTGPKGAITLRQLLSFTSGLPPANLCTSNPLTTLSACVDVISRTTLDAPPGTRFDYGSTHQHVAARMAEVATNRTWAQLVDEVLRTPLGLDAETEYFCAPNQRTGRLNPLVAGGLVITPNEYGRILVAALNRGVFAGATIGTPALYDEQAREPAPVTVGLSPAASVGYPFRYGLGAWLECATPSTGCAVISSPGAFGFTPWVDRSANVACMIVTQEARSSAADVGVVKFSIDLEQALQPLIRAAL